MARTPVTSTGTGSSPKTFQDWFCPSEQLTTPHAAGRILTKDASGIRLQTRCRRCGSVYERILSQPPEGHEIYQVFVTGEDGPHLPESLRPVPYLEEAFEVIAVSPQDAYERAEFAHSLRFAGHLVQYYINGELHLDERF